VVGIMWTQVWPGDSRIMHPGQLTVYRMIELRR